MRTTRRGFLAPAIAAGLLPSLTRTLNAQNAPAIAALRNRVAEAKPVTSSERESRLQRARELMARDNIAAVCIAGGSTLNYFTGVRWGNSERPTLLIIPRNGQPFAVTPAFEADRLHEQLARVASMARTRFYTWQENENPYQQVAAGLKATGIATGQIGIEETMPFAFAQGIGRASAQATLVSALPVTGGCRAIKSPAELALMQLANSITLQVYEAAWRAGHPGMTTREFSALIGAGYDRVGFPGYASCETGQYSALPHGSIQPQTIHENDVVLIDDGCVVEGYQSDISRTFVYGKPTDEMRRCFDIVLRAQSAGLSAARPGVPAGAVDAAARKVIVDAGYGPGYRNFTHRLGHGIGMDGHEWPYLVEGNSLPLAAGMTFSDEPGVYLPGKFGVRIEDDMYVTDSGAKLFTQPGSSLEDPFAKRL
jgi:Xaa-Pro dipeptidase